ncbi:galactose mutarotase [Clostridium swellfunianum]|uniref:aldose epimerase family protein n=1 Tax=Clostridium swellfunianum TaxID=1367462 RepID=UPI00202F0693|nr:aldose epimerase family protein [Clostridium swellfunianum]MCM0649745.1 galactose mutarotase [Clostridium swellfunianum]
MSITKRFSGKQKDGKNIDIFTLENSTGALAEITNLGGTILSLKVPDKNGKLADIVLGFENLEDYYMQGPYFGAIIGRFANRIGKARFELNGAKYKLNANDSSNHLHGGLQGFDKVVWEAETIIDGNEEFLVLSYVSQDGEENYPGNLKVKVTYTFTENNEIIIDYFAQSDKDTVVNLTNHSYFNLSGHASGKILNHKVMINADRFTPVDEEAIPTGEIRSVEGTPMDFRTLKTVGEDINSSYEQIVLGKGYDHNWVLNVSGGKPEKAAEVIDETSGRVLEVYTTKPGIQFYTGNFLNSTQIGKGKVAYEQRAGLCLETQYLPDSMNHEGFSSVVLKAFEEYKHKTIYKFSLIK